MAEQAARQFGGVAPARSTRRCRVRRPRSASQASIGPGTAPCSVRVARSAAAQAAPSRASPRRRGARRSGRRGTSSPSARRVGAELERALQQRGGEGVVDDDERAARACPAATSAAGRRPPASGWSATPATAGRRAVAGAAPRPAVSVMSTRRGCDPAPCRPGPPAAPACRVGVPRRDHRRRRAGPGPARRRPRPSRSRTAPRSPALERPERLLERRPRSGWPSGRRSALRGPARRPRRRRSRPARSGGSAARR